MSATTCPASKTTREQVVVWGQSLGPDSKGLEAMIRAFEARHQRYKVRMLSMGAGRMNPQKLMTSIVGRVPPDVIFQDRFTIADWASRGAFRALDDLIERDADAPRLEHYYPATWAEASYGGRVYGIPTGADDRVLYYNREVFRRKARELRAAGLDPDRPPRTWSEVLDYSKVLTERDAKGNLIRAGFLPNFGNSWLYLFGFQNNASFLSPDGRTCTLYSPEMEEALEFMVAGYKILGGYENAQRFQSGFQGGENDPFLIGKVAMKVDGDWIINDLSRFALGTDFGVAPPPVPDDRYFRRGRFANEKDQFVTWFGGFSYAIPFGARNVEGAWAFIKFATSLEGRQIELEGQREFERRRGRVFVPRLSAHIEANQLIEREFMPSDPRIRAALQMHIDMAPFGKIRPATPVGQLLWDEHVRAIENACLGLMTSKEALLRGQAVVQRELDAIAATDRLPKLDMRVPVFVTFGLIVLGLAGFAAWFRRVRLGRVARQEMRWGYLLIAPWIVGFLVFTLGPMVASLFFSFTQYNVLSDARWVGLGNYQTLFAADSEKVVKAFSNVLYLATVGVPLGLVTGLAIAMVLNTAVRGMRYYRTIFYLPSIVPTVASAVLWVWLLTPDANKGLVNSFWQSTIGQWFGVQAPGWLSSPDWARPALIVMGLWGAGGGMILWLAGLKGIPNQLYEAASIDGATPTQQFFSVTLPQLSPIIFFNAVMGFIGAVQEFDRVYVMAQGSAGPGDSLLVPVYHLFANGFAYFRMGYASALAWAIFVVILVLTLVQFRLAPRWVHYEAEK
jgi:multiple sugar transport system permease protein